MAKVRWASPVKGEGSNEKCPATAGNRAGRGGFGRKREGVCRGVAFCVGPAYWRCHGR